VDSRQPQKQNAEQKQGPQQPEAMNCNHSQDQKTKTGEFDARVELLKKPTRASDVFRQQFGFRKSQERAHRLFDKSRFHTWSAANLVQDQTYEQRKKDDDADPQSGGEKVTEVKTPGERERIAGNRSFP